MSFPPSLQTGNISFPEEQLGKERHSMYSVSCFPLRIQELLQKSDTGSRSTPTATKPGCFEQQQGLFYARHFAFWRQNMFGYLFELCDFDMRSFRMATAECVKSCAALLSQTRARGAPSPILARPASEKDGNLFMSVGGLNFIKCFGDFWGFEMS